MFSGTTIRAVADSVFYARTCSTRESILESYTYLCEAQEIKNFAKIVLNLSIYEQKHNIEAAIGFSLQEGKELYAE